jgi:hypothetical protein
MLTCHVSSRKQKGSETELSVGIASHTQQRAISLLESLMRGLIVQAKLISQEIENHLLGLATLLRDMRILSEGPRSAWMRVEPFLH